MTVLAPIQLLDRIADRGDAIRILDGIEAEMFHAGNIDGFIAVDNVRAYLVLESKKDLAEARRMYRT